MHFKVKAAWLPQIVKAAWLPLWAIGLQASPAQAQVASSPIVRAEPSDAKAAVPATPYRSPLAGYRAFNEPAVAPWRDTNELVRQRGGWRGYAREAREPEAAPAPASGASR